MTRVIADNTETARHFGVPRSRAAYQSQLGKLSEESRSMRRKWLMNVLQVGLCSLTRLLHIHCCYLYCTACPFWLLLPSLFLSDSLHFCFDQSCIRQGTKFQQSWLDIHDLLRPIYTDVPDTPCLARVDSKVRQTPLSTRLVNTCCVSAAF